MNLVDDFLAGMGLTLTNPLGKKTCRILNIHPWRRKNEWCPSLITNATQSRGGVDRRSLSFSN